MITIRHKRTGKALRTFYAQTLRDVDLRGSDLIDSDLSGANLSGSDLRALTIGDPRGYRAVAVPMADNNWTIVSGCRLFPTIDEGLRHWGSPDYHTPAIGREYVRGLHLFFADVVFGGSGGWLAPLGGGES